MQDDSPCSPPVLQSPAAGLSSWVDLCTFEGLASTPARSLAPFAAARTAECRGVSALSQTLPLLGD